MNRSMSLRISAALFSVTLGILLWRLPEQWIEIQFGSQSLDGGNGLVEFLLATIPALIGVALMLSRPADVANKRSIVARRF